jgi:hypothetical protein
MVDVGRVLIWILVNRGLLARHPEHRYDTQLQHLQHDLQFSSRETVLPKRNPEFRIPNGISATRSLLFTPRFVVSLYLGARSSL